MSFYIHNVSVLLNTIPHTKSFTVFISVHTDDLIWGFSELKSSLSD